MWWLVGGFRADPASATWRKGYIGAGYVDLFEGKHSIWVGAGGSYICVLTLRIISCKLKG